MGLNIRVHGVVCVVASDRKAHGLSGVVERIARRVFQFYDVALDLCLRLELSGCDQEHGSGHAGVCDPALHVVEVGGALIGSGLNDLAAIDVYHFVEPFCCVIHVSASSFLYAVTSYIGIVILIMVPCPATLLIVLCWYAACSP